MPGSSTPAAETSPSPSLSLSPGFAAWLHGRGASIALTTYQAGRLFFIGLRPDGQVRAHERRIDQCQGLWTDGQSLWTSDRARLWRFANTLPPGRATASGADRLFAPREARVTGAVDCHDIGLGADGAPVFVNTAFNCLATISDSDSFRSLWRPPFISALVPEDRCHLNGLAMDGTRPAHVTAVSRSDLADGWRQHRRDGGVVIEVASGEIVASGFSMPHSPRWHEGRLWLLNSGTGEFGTLDPADGTFTPIAFCPGYARGLAFLGGCAVIGLSRARNNRAFEGLALEDRLDADGVRGGLLIVDLASGEAVHWLRFETVIDELYDVAVLPGVRQAEAIGFLGEDIERVFSIEDP
ncbi:uncharacterized protein (TIGR03032 family) [Caulobacter ginsengisoli]|uniref:Uncharacterized protein (TIGR03032 family) n=1 Tax=Caulobacter ginsengisoli TaxID=400775 RepID=A0ABU0IRT5_9CAUL|nr:TIGR03032 family protein [Caulobacter ginsengisoli]MDQ0464727.1 uncharacterized protein (TIGR03032 family) [Caulobacter ginsengisoli]